MLQQKLQCKGKRAALVVFVYRHVQKSVSLCLSKWGRHVHKSAVLCLSKWCRHVQKGELLHKVMWGKHVHARAPCSFMCSAKESHM